MSVSFPPLPNRLQSLIIDIYLQSTTNSVMHLLECVQSFSKTIRFLFIYDVSLCFTRWNNKYIFAGFIFFNTQNREENEMMRMTNAIKAGVIHTQRSD